jgi:predicted nucleotidyltransferase
MAKSYSEILLDKVMSNRDEINTLCANRGFSFPRVFGSVVNGIATEQSDIDILVSLEDANITYLSQGGLVVELSSLLGVPVDIVVDTEVRDEMRKDILEGQLLAI